MDRRADQTLARDDRAVTAVAPPERTERASFIAYIRTRTRPETFAGTEEIDSAQLQSMAEIPNPIRHGPVALAPTRVRASSVVRASQRIVAAEVRRQAETNRPACHDAVAADIPLVARRLGILELRNSVSGHGLPAAAEPLGQRKVHSMVVRPALEQFEVHVAPLGEGSPADVAKRIVRSSRRVVGQVHVRSAFLAPASGENVIGLECDIVPELSLDSNRHLVAVRGLAARIVDLLRERTIRTAGYKVDVTGTLERILEAGLGPTEPPPKPIPERCEIGPAVIEVLALKSVRIADSLLDSIVRRHSKEEPISAAQNCLIIEPEVHA